MNCLVGCVNSYNKKGLRKPYNLAVMMPWCELKTKVGGKELSVANWSSKYNKACISSFQFGGSNGVGAFIEVVDEEGGEFDNFFRKISAGNMDTGFSNKSLIEFRFGWAWQNCKTGDSSYGTYGYTASTPHNRINYDGPVMSKWHTLFIKNVSVNVSSGAYKYSLECADQTLDNFTSRIMHICGDDAHPMYLTDAISAVLGVIGIYPVFKQLAADGKLTDFKFDRTGNIDEKKGPKDTWRSMGRDPISSSRSWLDSYCSKRQKGSVCLFSSEKGKERQLFFIETPKPTCYEVGDFSYMNLGTYIVNGSGCSPVLSFNPKIQYNMIQALTGTSGIMQGSIQPKMKKEVGPDPCFDRADTQALMDKISKYQGFQTTWIATDADYNIFRDAAADAGGANRMRHQHANIMSPPFTAELRIQGDPSFSDTTGWFGWYVTLVYYNPFRVGMKGDKCEWLSLGGCNPYLSSTNWMIRGVYHEIKLGSFTTTLNLSLAMPGLDIPPMQPIGAAVAPKV